MPEENQKAYVQAVLTLYRRLPDTPARPRRADRRLAEQLYRRGIDLEIVEVALRLATGRRHARSADAIPLSPVRSLHYFLPVIDEMPEGPPPEGYLEYLRDKTSAGEPSADKTELSGRPRRSTQATRNDPRQLSLPLDLGACPEKDGSS